jgi:hypothetical protein
LRRLVLLACGCCLSGSRTEFSAGVETNRHRQRGGEVLGVCVHNNCVFVVAANGATPPSVTTGSLSIQERKEAQSKNTAGRHVPIFDGPPALPFAFRECVASDGSCHAPPSTCLKAYPAAHASCHHTPSTGPPSAPPAPHFPNAARRRPTTTKSSPTLTSPTASPLPTSLPNHYRRRIQQHRPRQQGLWWGRPENRVAYAGSLVRRSMGQGTWGADVLV